MASWLTEPTFHASFVKEEDGKNERHLLTQEETKRETETEKRMLRAMLICFRNDRFFS